MASAVDSRLAYARLSAVATASRLPTATRGSNNSYTTSWDTTLRGLPLMVSDAFEECVVARRMEGVESLLCGGARILRPVPQQRLRSIVHPKLTAERGGVDLDLLADRGPGQPVGAAHPEKRRHLKRLRNLLLQRRDTIGERLGSGRVEGMDGAAPQWSDVLVPVAVKLRRLSVDREAARERLRRCR